ncbi:MAG: hypothetical protein AVDCRST_MAG38-1990, partial [uncultured Solirubrobacteraceae bacterium]
ASVHPPARAARRNAIRRAGPA